MILSVFRPVRCTRPQVLKRVGQECEAHGVVYWTAAAVGDLTKYEVRRPYSIRTQREKGPDQARAGTSSMAEQIKFAGEAGDRLKDRPSVGDTKGGRPEVVIADVFATAALLAAVKTGELKPFGLTKHNVVLYFDEPNMGLHLSKATADAAANIMRDAPVAAVLASATLPSWGALPSWWRGDGSPASRTVITQEPCVPASALPPALPLREARPWTRLCLPPPTLPSYFSCLCAPIFFAGTTCRTRPSPCCRTGAARRSTCSRSSRPSRRSPPSCAAARSASACCCCAT